MLVQGQLLSESKTNSVLSGDSHNVLLNHQRVRVKFFYQSPLSKKILRSNNSKEKLLSVQREYMKLPEISCFNNEQSGRALSSDRFVGEESIRLNLHNQGIDENEYSNNSSRKKCYNPQEQSRRFYFSNIKQAERDNVLLKQYQMMQDGHPNLTLETKKKTIKLKLFKDHNILPRVTNSQKIPHYKFITLSKNYPRNRKKAPYTIVHQDQPDIQNTKILIEPFRTQPKTRQAINYAAIYLYNNPNTKTPLILTKNNGIYSTTSKKPKQLQSENFQQEKHRKYQSNQNSPFNLYYTPIKSVRNGNKSCSGSKSKKGITVLSHSSDFSSKLYARNDRKISDKLFLNRVNNPIQRLRSKHKSKHKFIRQSPNSQTVTLEFSAEPKRLMFSRKLQKRIS